MSHMKGYIGLSWRVVDGKRQEPPVRLLVRRPDEESARARLEYEGDGEREVEIEREATREEMEFYDPDVESDEVVAHNTQPPKTV